ncbi:hypothetical protein [Streptomyces flavidovirens]
MTVNAGVGATFSWGVNQVHCRPTDPWASWAPPSAGCESLFAERVTESAHTNISANAFRTLREGEDASAGLFRPGAEANVAPWQHVMGHPNSPWISLTADPRIMYNIYGEGSAAAGRVAHGYIAVDLSRVTSETVDAGARLDVPDYIRELDE